MSGITASTVANALKQLYAGQAVNNLAFDKDSRPFMSMLKKNPNFAGAQMPMPYILDGAAGISADFTSAQTAAAGRTLGKWLMDVVVGYGFEYITNEAILRMRNDKGSFLSGVKFAVDGMLEGMADDFERSLFADDSSGSLGTISATSGTTITLTDKRDAVKFSIGKSYVAADSVDSSLRSATPGVVSAINPDTGVITFSAAVSGTFIPQAGDYIFNYGDYASASDENKIAGLGKWLPTTAPTSGDSHFGVDRSVYPGRLTGRIISGSSGDVEGSIRTAAYELLATCPAAKPNIAWVSPANGDKLASDVRSGIVINNGGSSVTLGQSSFAVNGPKGPVAVKVSPYCPDDKAYLLSLDTWEVLSMGDLIQLDNLAGTPTLNKVYNADSKEVRAFSWANLYCKAPGRNAVVTL